MLIRSKECFAHLRPSANIAKVGKLTGYAAALDTKEGTNVKANIVSSLISDITT